MTWSRDEERLGRLAVQGWTVSCTKPTNRILVGGLWAYSLDCSRYCLPIVTFTSCAKYTKRIDLEQVPACKKIPTTPLVLDAGALLVPSGYKCLPTAEVLGTLD